MIEQHIARGRLLALVGSDLPLKFVSALPPHSYKGLQFFLGSPPSQIRSPHYYDSDDYSLSYSVYSGHRFVTDDWLMLDVLLHPQP